VLVWHLQEFPTGPTGTSFQSEQQQRSGLQEGGRSRARRRRRRRRRRRKVYSKLTEEETFCLSRDATEGLEERESTLLGNNVTVQKGFLG